MRILLLLSLIPTSVWAYLTPRFTGGVDAKWYAYALLDHIQQTRAGIFPVWVGQGEFMFNGAVHPYRSAPAYQNLGSLLDWLSSGTLGVFAVQHATVLVSFVASLFVAYAVLVRLAPDRRGWAALTAAVYALSPGLLGLIAAQEMYMSYMTAPLVALAGGMLLSVLRAVAWRDCLGLAAALSGLWYCHTPIALWTAVAVFGVLALHAVMQADFGRRAVALATMGLAVACLSYFHFRNVGEVTAPGALRVLLREWPLAVGALALLALGRAMRTRDRMTWLGAAVLIALTLWRSWQLGVALAGATVLAWAWCARRPSKEPMLEWGAVIVVTVFLLGLVRVGSGAPCSPAADAMAAFTPNFWPGAFLPIRASFALSDVQPGWGALALGLAGAAGALTVSRRRPELVPLSAMAVVFALLVLPLPLVSRQLWGVVPVEILVATSGVPNFRLSPAWTMLLCFGGFAAITATERPRRERLVLIALAAAAAWGAWQIQIFNRRVAALEQNEVQSGDLLRTELVPLGVYPFNFLNVPPRFSHGVMDVRSETRLLTPSLTVEQGHRAPSVGRDFVLVMRPDPSVSWARSGQTVTVQPGERLRLEFEFREPGRAGVLILSGSRFYREYILPSSGGAESFGSGETNGRDIKVWNSLELPVEFEFFWASPEPVPAGGVELARVTVFADHLPNAVRIESLIPLRARVSAREPGVLETPRRHLAGYRAWVNGREVPYIQTLAGQIGVPVPAGESVVELSFEGTAAVKRALWLSAASWALVIGALILAIGWNFLRGSG